MENMPGGRCGPQLYLLSEEHFESLKDIQVVLTLLAQITYSKSEDAKQSAMLAIGRAELCFIFEAINAKIDDVVKRIGNENWLGAQSSAWQ